VLLVDKKVDFGTLAVGLRQERVRQNCNKHADKTRKRKTWLDVAEFSPFAIVNPTQVSKVQADMCDIDLPFFVWLMRDFWRRPSDSRIRVLCPPWSLLTPQSR
jgi:hypothetical protein